MTSRLRNLVIACAVLLTFSAAMFVRGQAASNITNLRDQLRQRYDIVALQDGLGLVPRQPIGDVRLIEIRNGGVAINGDTVTAREARAQLGKDAELILRVTYLDAAALRQMASADSAATPSAGNTEENTNESETNTRRANPDAPRRSGSHRRRCHRRPRRSRPRRRGRHRRLRGY